MKPKIIMLPRRMGDPSDFHGVFSRLFGEYADNLPPHIVFDISQVTFIQPLGVVFLYNTVLWLERRAVKCEIATGPNIGAVSAFLDDSGLFLALVGSTLRPFASLRPTTLGLKLVSHAESHHWLSNNVVPWLIDRRGLPAPSLYSIKACILELFANIADHTRSQIGCVFAQHFPASNTIKFAFSDVGDGIPVTVRRLHPTMPSAEAIVLSTTEGFTVKSKPSNQGIGLKYLLDVIVITMDGTVTIFSLDGKVAFRKNTNGQIEHSMQSEGYLPGTTFELIIPIANIPLELEEEVPFEWS